MGSRNASLCTDVGTARQSLTMLHGAVRSDLGCSWLPLQHMLSSAGDMQLLPLPHKLGPGRNNQELQLEPLDVANKCGKAEQKLQWPKPQGREARLNHGFTADLAPSVLSYTVLQLAPGNYFP